MGGLSYGMNTGGRNVLLLFLLFVASGLFASTPEVRVDVRQKAGGKLLQYTFTDDKGNFRLGAIPAGVYSLEFHLSSKQSSHSDKNFLLIIAGANENGMLTGIPGSDLKRGVAIDISVAGDARVSGQMATAEKGPRKGLLVWVPPQVGSNTPGHWEPAGGAATIPMHPTSLLSKQAISKIQDHGDVAH